MATSLMDATLAVPQVLVSHDLPATETAQYTTPAVHWTKIGSASLANHSRSAVIVSLSVSKAIGSPVSVVGGDVLMAGSAEALTTAGAYFTRPDHIVTGAGTLASVSLNVTTAGTVGISIGTILDSVYTERVRIAAVSLGTGVQTLTPNVAVNPGEVVGIFGTASFYIAAKTGSNTDDVVFATNAVTTVVPNWEWGFQITVSVTGAGFANRVLPPYTLEPGDSTLLSELVDVFLGPTDFISAIASAAGSVAFVATGVVFS